MNTSPVSGSAVKRSDFSPNRLYLFETLTVLSTINKTQGSIAMNNSKDSKALKEAPKVQLCSRSVSQSLLNKEAFISFNSESDAELLMDSTLERFEFLRRPLNLDPWIDSLI